MTSNSNKERKSNCNSNRNTYKNKNIDRNSNSNSRRCIIRNTYKQNLQGNNGTNSNCAQRVNIRNNGENELKTKVRRDLDSSKPQHSTHMKKTKHTDSHLIHSRPSVGIYYSYYTMATKHYFNRTEKPTYHNLCT